VSDGDATGASRTAAVQGAADGSAGVVDARMFTVGPVQENAYVVRADAASERALLVDPGEEPQRLLDAVAALGVKVEAILITHCHFDHIGAVAPIARATGAPVYCPRLEEPLLTDVMAWTPPGFGPFESWTPEHTLAGGERLSLAGIDIEVLFTPGHSPGHLTYAMSPAAGVRAAASTTEQPTPTSGGEAPAKAPDAAPALFSGDVLFQGSIGRTDLPGGDWDVLERSIAALMQRFPGASTIYPGHMGVTTLGRELRGNPFLEVIRSSLGPGAAASTTRMPADIRAR
jgi:hydroxyacylglutathione hydrolase